MNPNKKNHWKISRSIVHGFASMSRIFRSAADKVSVTSSTSRQHPKQTKSKTSFFLESWMLVKVLSLSQEKPRVRNLSARKSGAGNGCANLMCAWHFLFFFFFCWKTPMPIKFLVFFGGGVVGFFWKGGRKCQFYCYGRGDVSNEGIAILISPEPP